MLYVDTHSKLKNYNNSTDTCLEIKTKEETKEETSLV
jgi:hypothetical protein